MSHLTNLRIDEVHECILLRPDIDKDKFTIIIMGRSGRTGKTALWRRLKDAGYNVFELSEDVMGLVTFNDDINHIIINHFYEHVIVVLNEFF